MGVSIDAYVVIGIKVDTSRLASYEKVKAFEHNYPEDWEFNPQSGAPLWKEEVVPKPHVLLPYEGESLELNLSDGARVGNYNIVYSRTNETAYIALKSRIVNERNKDRFLSLQGLEKDLDQMRKELTDLGFWDESSFGIYTFLEVN